jgi:basic membrane lipoprotein Med (substrate-binding protein (PBP1-ABC) superfamily)
VLAENVPENGDVERVMQRMSDAGAKLIFSTSYGYADFSLRVAKTRPDVIFMQAQAPISAPNANTYNAKIWEASYVSGVVAAMTLKKETRFGFVGAQPIPPINWTVNSFALGARSVNPAVTVDVVYTNSWNNPAAETEAVNSLAAKGVKVVYILVDSPIAGVQAAEQAGIYSISHHADLSSFAPKGYLTGAMWDWTSVYVDAARSTMSGTWKSEPMVGGFKEGYVKLAPFGPAVDIAGQQRARETIANIVSGKLKIFEGPLVDNTGMQRVAKGEVLDVPKIVSMDWLVQGVRSAK